MESLANHPYAEMKRALPERSYELTERQLWQLVSSVLRNLSQAADSKDTATPFPTAESTTNITQTDLTTANDTLSHDEKMMICYMIVFFFWYGGLIFACLIGFGVYKKPYSYEMYRRFVDRQDLREKIKQEKLAEIERKKVERQNSLVSSLTTSPSAGSNLSNSCNGGIFSYDRSVRSLPRSLSTSPRAVYREEEECLLYDTTNKQTNKPAANGKVIFDI